MLGHTPRLTLTLAALLLSLTGAQLSPAAETPKEPLLSGDEVHKLVDAGQYKDALKGVARILALSGPAAAGYDHDDLMLVKADCQFEIHDTQGALATLTQLQKDAAAANKPNDVLTAAAFAELLQKSPSGIYTARTAATKAAYKIADHAERKNAYDALFADDMAAFQLKAIAATNSGKLPPLIEAAKSALAARAAEYVSTGSNEQTKNATRDLGERAIKLLNTTLDQLATTQARIDTNANRIVSDLASTTRGPSGTAVTGYLSHARGLTDADTNALKDIIATCTKIQPVATQLGQAFINQADDFKAVVARATELQAKADTTLKADYTGLNSPTSPR